MEHGVFVILSKSESADGGAGEGAGEQLLPGQGRGQAAGVRVAAQVKGPPVGVLAIELTEQGEGAGESGMDAGMPAHTDLIQDLTVLRIPASELR